MKQKILTALLTAVVIGTLGSTVPVQAYSMDSIKSQLQNKGIVISGNVSSLEELKQKLEEMGIDCSNPNWIQVIIPGFPEFPPFNPELPDGNEPDKPDVPDDNQPDTPEEDTNASFIRQVADLVNEERAKAGLSPLAINSDVQAAAQVRAKEIETAFSHTRPDGTSFSTALTQQGVSYRGSGENIAWGQKTPEEVMKGWMNSAGHRANILNKNFTTIGVGYYQNASGTNHWTQLFTY